MFKNVIYYKLGSENSIEKIKQLLISDTVSEIAFKPCNNSQYSTVGLVNVFNEKDTENLYYENTNGILLKFKKEEKILPKSVIDSFLLDRIEDITQKVGKKPSKGEISSIKDEVIATLLPKAFSKYKYTYMWIDYKNKFMAVDSSNIKAAEDVISFIRKFVGILEAIQLQYQSDSLTFSQLLTKWIKEVDGEDFPNKFTLSNKVTLADPLSSAKASISNEDLTSQEVINHIDAGKTVEAITLYFDNKMSFNLKKDLTISNIKYDEEVKVNYKQEQSEINQDIDANIYVIVNDFTLLYIYLLQFIEIDEKNKISNK